MDVKYKNIIWTDGYDCIRESRAVKAWTDYPIIELGDRPGEEAPIRECWVLAAYRNSRYLFVYLDELARFTEIKHCYVYRSPGRYGEVKAVNLRHVCDLGGKPLRLSMKARYRKTTYRLYKDAVLVRRFSNKRSLVKYIKNHSLLDDQVHEWVVHQTIDFTGNNGQGYASFNEYPVYELI